MEPFRNVIEDYYFSRYQEIIDKIKAKIGCNYKIKTNFDIDPLFPEVKIDVFYIGGDSFLSLSNNLYSFLLGLYCSEKIEQDKVKSALE